MKEGFVIEEVLKIIKADVRLETKEGYRETHTAKARTARAQSVQQKRGNCSSRGRSFLCVRVPASSSFMAHVIRTPRHAHPPSSADISTRNWPLAVTTVFGWWCRWRTTSSSSPFFCVRASCYVPPHSEREKRNSTLFVNAKSQKRRFCPEKNRRLHFHASFMAELSFYFFGVGRSCGVGLCEIKAKSPFLQTKHRKLQGLILGWT